MATIGQMMEAEERVRTLLGEEGLPEPDRVEYCPDFIRLFWHEPKVVLVVDFDEAEAEAYPVHGLGEPIEADEAGGAEPDRL